LLGSSVVVLPAVGDAGPVGDPGSTATSVVVWPAVGDAGPVGDPGSTATSWLLASVVVLPAVGDAGPVGDPGSTATSWLLASVVVLPAVGDAGPVGDPGSTAAFGLLGSSVVVFPAVGDTGPFGEAGVAARSVCGRSLVALPGDVGSLGSIGFFGEAGVAARSVCGRSVVAMHGEMGSVGSIGTSGVEGLAASDLGLPGECPRRVVAGEEVLEVGAATEAGFRSQKLAYKGRVTEDCKGVKALEVICPLVMMTSAFLKLLLRRREPTTEHKADIKDCHSTKETCVPPVPPCCDWKFWGAPSTCCVKVGHNHCTWSSRM